MRTFWPVLAVGLAIGGALLLGSIGALRRGGESPNHGFGSDWSCSTSVRGDPVCVRRAVP